MFEREKKRNRSTKCEVGGLRERQREETMSVETNKQTTTIITNGKASQMLINKDPLDSEVNGLSQGDVVTLHPPS